MSGAWSSAHTHTYSAERSIRLLGAVLNMLSGLNKHTEHASTDVHQVLACLCRHGRVCDIMFRWPRTGSPTPDSSISSFPFPAWPFPGVVHVCPSVRLSVTVWGSQQVGRLTPTILLPAGLYDVSELKRDRRALSETQLVVRCVLQEVEVTAGGEEGNSRRAGSSVEQDRRLLGTASAVAASAVLLFV